MWHRGRARIQIRDLAHVRVRDKIKATVMVRVCQGNVRHTSGDPAFDAVDE